MKILSKDKKLPIVFYFPWEEPSGGPVYLTSIARAIVRIYPAPVYYADYEPGLSDPMLEDSGVRKIAVSAADLSIGLTEPVILVTPVYWADRLPPMHPNSKILFLNWHNLCIPVLHSTWGITPTELQSFLVLLNRTNSVAYCDSAHRAAQEAFGVATLPNYIPIGAELTTSVREDYSGQPQQLRLAILGRLVIDKVFSVTNLARLLDAYSFEGEKVLHVIGDGPERDRIRSEDYPTVTLVMTGSIFGEALERYILANVDVLFAMGTSALLPARMAVPSVVVCNELHDYFDDVFVYLHESTGAALGWQVHQIAEMGLVPRTLANILSEVQSPARREKIGHACRNYVRNVHSIDVMTDSFLKAIAETRLTIMCFDARLRPSWFGEVEHFNIWPFGRFKTFLCAGGARFVYREDGRIVAHLPPSGLKRLAWRLGRTISLVPKLPRLLLRKVRTFNGLLFSLREINNRTSILEERTNDINNRTTQANFMLEQLSVQLAQVDAALDRLASGANSTFTEKLRDDLQTDLRSVASEIANKASRAKDEVTSPIPSGHARMYLAEDIISSSSFEAFAGDVTARYHELVKDLDEQSRAIATRTLRRLRQYAETGETVLQITQAEEDEYRQLLDYHYNRILPLSDGWYLYDATWFLPSSEISSTVFFYKHFLLDLEVPERLRNCDVLDIGAHMGDSAIIFSEITDGMIWSFEPSPSNFAMLVQTIARNALTQVKAVQIALGDAEGEATLLEMGDMSKLTTSDEGEKVELTTVDAFVERHGIVPGLMKLDVEGFEMQVLSGAEQTIRRYRPVLLVSIYHNFDQFFGVRQWVEALDLGYRFKLRKPADLGVAVDLNLICEPDRNWSALDGNMPASSAP